MRILLALDKFKGSLTAPEALRALRLGLEQSLPGAELVDCPIADGGEGTIAAAVAAGFERVPAIVSGPCGEPLSTHFALRGTEAVVEMALASGLQLMPGQHRSPMTASSYGTGQLIAAALGAGARTIMLGIGGSACTDGGAGLVTALGVRLRDACGRDVAPGGRALADLADLNLDLMQPVLAGRGARPPKFVVACDVTNPLLGPTGAAVVYGPQKGATRKNVAELDHALAHWADVVEQTTGIRAREEPGAGAAGGVGFAAMVFLGATLRSGIEVILDLLDFQSRLAGADLVLTGEGSFDEQTLFGKAPTGVAMAAQRAGVPVVAVAGSIRVSTQTLANAGFAGGYALSDLEGSTAVCITHAATLLEQIGRRIGEDLTNRQLVG